MKIIAAAYFGLVVMLMGSTTVLFSAEALFCTQKASPTWCKPIGKITDAFFGY